MTLVEPDAELQALPVAAAVWEPHPSLPVSAECWLLAGGPHHTVLTTAVGSDVIDQFAEMVEIELALIDADSRPRRFREELRWSSAYRRLRLGL